VLSAASLRAYPGEVSALLGRNGAGKSTLLRIASGHLQPDSGIVHFAGTAHLAASHARLARAGLFLVPVRGLLSRVLTVGRQLELVQRQFKTGAVDAVVQTLRLGEFLGRAAPDLSGGEARRAEIGLAMLRRPRCLLADEPFLGVGPKDVDVLAGAFRSMADAGCAVVVTGHEVRSLFAVASRVTWCTDGTTYELGAPALANTHERFRREYLGPQAM
jgi:ABC-type multidrug transport system ATPase subunit